MVPNDMEDQNARTNREALVAFLGILAEIEQVSGRGCGIWSTGTGDIGDISHAVGPQADGHTKQEVCADMSSELDRGISYHLNTTDDLVVHLPSMFAYLSIDESHRTWALITGVSTRQRSIQMMPG